MNRSLALVISSMVFGVVALLGGAAHAQTVWSETGEGCVPDHNATTNDLFFHSGGSVKFNTNATGSFTVLCPVTSVDDIVNLNPNRLYVTFQDSDGTTSVSPDINAKLKRLPRSNGASTTTIAEFDSSDSMKGGNSTTTAQQLNVSFTHTFDFETYYYFVVVTIARSSTSQTSTLYGVALANVIGE